MSGGGAVYAQTPHSIREALRQRVSAEYPHAARGPIVFAAQIFLALHSIVSPETGPGEQAVVTVGSIQRGRSTTSFRTKFTCN